MSFVLPAATEVVTAQAVAVAAPQEAADRAPVPVSAEQEATVAAAEVIAAEAGIAVAVEAAAAAEAMVTAAAGVAAKAAVRARHTAQAAAEIAAMSAADMASEAAIAAEALVTAATAAAEKAAATALQTQADAGATGMAAEIAAEAAATAEAMVTAASAAAAKAALRARQTAQTAADVAARAAADVAHEAVRTADAMVVTAGAAAAKAVARADLAARTSPPIASAAAVAASPPAPAPAVAPSLVDRDLTARTEWAAFLADPVMPTFSAGVEGDDVTLAAPADRGLWRDISLARRMQESVRESEAHFEAAFHSAPSALLIVALVDGVPADFIRANEAMSLLTGYTPFQLPGMTFADLTHPEPHASEDDDGDPRRCPEQGWIRRWVHADGHDLWVRVRMSAMRTSSLRSEQLICQIDDVRVQVPAGLFA